MNPNCKVYNLYYAYNIPASGGSDIAIYEINEVGRWFNLEKLIWTVGMRELTGQRNVPLAGNDKVRMRLVVNNLQVGTASNIATMKYISGAGGDLFNNTIQQPGVYSFQNYRFYETAFFMISVDNQDAAIVSMESDITAELEFFDPNG